MKFTVEQHAENRQKLEAAIAAHPDGIETAELRDVVAVSHPILHGYLKALVDLGRVRSSIRRHRQRMPPFGAYDARVYFPADEVDASAGPEPKRRDARRTESEVGP